MARAKFGDAESKHFRARITQLRAARSLADLPPPPPLRDGDEFKIPGATGINIYAQSGHPNEPGAPDPSEWTTLNRLYVTRILREQHEQP